MFLRNHIFDTRCMCFVNILLYIPCAFHFSFIIFLSRTIQKKQKSQIHICVVRAILVLVSSFDSHCGYIHVYCIWTVLARSLSTYIYVLICSVSFEQERKEKNKHISFKSKPPLNRCLSLSTTHSIVIISQW